MNIQDLIRERIVANIKIGTKGKNEYIDVNVPGEGWVVYKALSGAYKYAITQTFAIPTIDDAKKEKYTTENIDNGETNNNNVNKQGGLNESNVEKLFGDPDIDDYNSIFDLGNKAG